MSSELFRRVISGLVLAVVALAITAFGGIPFALFWMAAAIVVCREWITVAAGGALPVILAGAAAQVAATAAAAAGHPELGLLALAAGAMVAALLIGKPHRAWAFSGVFYAGILALAPMVLRGDPQYGLAAILFLFAVVWSTDIFGYAAGRLIGGPKLAPAISPKKTWSGACAGTFGALAAGTAVAAWAGVPSMLSPAVVAVVLSLVAQAGDLFESAIKRRFGVKDASDLIPGHGGLMDRLDGFITAAGFAALIGITRGGVDFSAHGLLAW